MTAAQEMDDAPGIGIGRRRPAPRAAISIHGPAEPSPRKAARTRRPCLPDEERRLLREAEAAFEGSDRRHDADAATHSAWDEEDDPPSDAAPSRLFRD